MRKTLYKQKSFKSRNCSVWSKNYDALADMTLQINVPTWKRAWGWDRPQVHWLMCAHEGESTNYVACNTENYSDRRRVTVFRQVWVTTCRLTNHNILNTTVKFTPQNSLLGHYEQTYRWRPQRKVGRSMTSSTITIIFTFKGCSSTLVGGWFWTCIWDVL
jgi:hypothetical protein